MGKRSEKRICWNCDCDVSLHLERCPYCGVDVGNPAPPSSPKSFAQQELGSPFQASNEKDPFHFHPPSTPSSEKALSVSDEEWKESMEDEDEEEGETAKRREIFALVLLLPGVVFLLFGLLLLFFSREGALTLHWKQSLSFFYFLSAIPLIMLGWRAIR